MARGLKAGDLVVYPTVAGDELCEIVYVGPRLIRIRLADGQLRTVSPKSVITQPEKKETA